MNNATTESIDFTAILEETDNVTTMKNLDAIRDLAKRTLAAYAACTDGKTSAKLLEAVDDVVNHFTSVSKEAFYQTALESEDAMKFAVNEWAFPTIRVKETRNKKEKSTKYEIIDSRMPIDLSNLHKWVAKKDGYDGIGANRTWQNILQSFNIDMGKVAASELRDFTTLARFKDPTQRRIKEGTIKLIDDEFNCTMSDEKGIEKVTECIQAMIGNEFAADEVDWKYVYRVYVTDNKGSARSVKLANDSAFTNMMKKVCYRHLNHLPNYDVLSKLLKKLEK